MRGTVDECFIEMKNKVALVHLNGGYTKDEVISMLTDLELEIEKNQIIAPQDSFYDKKLDGQFNKGISKASEIIQQKINSLKENENGQE